MFNAAPDSPRHEDLKRSVRQLAACTRQILEQVEQQAEYAKELQEHATLIAQAQAKEEALVRQKALVKISNRIRRSLDWSVICQTATAEVRELLNADRVAIYRFNDDWSGRFVFESAGEKWRPLVSNQAHSETISDNISRCSVRLLATDKTTDEANAQITDTYLSDTQGRSFAQGEIFRICSDTHDAGFSDCYVEALDSYQARAYVIVAIYVDRKLWGLLAAYQNSGPRTWQEGDVQLVAQVAEQLGIALKQSAYVQTIKDQSAELQQTLQQLKQSQVQLIQHEKMASLGQLVAGIAHEINNPVNFIYANLSHVKNYTDDLLSLAALVHPENASALDMQAFKGEVESLDVPFITEDLPKTLASMKVGAERIRHIVLSLRNFSRLDEADTKQADVHQGLDSTLLILGHRFKAHSSRVAVDVIKDYGSLPLVECYPAQLNQVFMNLLANALDALDEAIEVGKLSVGGSDKDDTETLTQRELPKIWITTRFNPQSQVEIRIRDNGIGLEPSAQSKMFDHFFTTKEVGKGTGLGLAISKQIIEEHHGGRLYVQPISERGVEFVICLSQKLPAL